MESANLTSMVEGLGRTSVQAGVLVVVILAAQWLLRKQLNPRWRCGLWMLVVARLLLPVSIGSAASIFNLIPLRSDRGPHVSGPIARLPVADGGGSIAVPEPDLVSNEKTLLQQPLALESIPAPARSEPGEHTRVASAPTATEMRPAPASGERSGWVGVLFWAWISGAFVTGGYVLVASLGLARRFATLRQATDPVVLAVLEDCRARMGVRSLITVVESGAVSSPALYGLLHPRLVLPTGFSTSFSERELRFIFLHEIAHLKRFDLPVNWLIAVLQAVHWFNPLVWIGFARWRGDRELACDAMALDAAGGNQNGEYGRTILRLMAGFTRGSQTPGLVGILESKQHLRRRIGMIATYVPGGRWQMLALVVGATIGLTCLTDAETEAAITETDPRSSDSPAEVSGAGALISRTVVTNGAVMKVIVLDDATGGALMGAEVLAPCWVTFVSWDENAPRWVTDQDGRANIRLGDVPTNHLAQESRFALSVRHRGFAPCGMSWAADREDVRRSLPGEVVVRLRRGITVGGYVRDEKGSPVPGVRVRVFGTGSWGGFRHQYPQFWTDGTDRPQVVTDDRGHWEARDFPPDLDGMTVVLIRPNGSSQRFRKAYPGWELDPRQPGDPISLEDFKAAKALFVLRSGSGVRGVVVDPDGKPVPNLLVKAGTGTVNQQRLAEFRTDALGQFQLHHLVRRHLILTAYPTDFAITSTVAEVGSNAPAVQLRLMPQRPLHIRVIDGEGRRLAGAQVSVDGYRTEAQVLDWTGETDRDGLLVWTNAPLSAFALTAKSVSPKCRQKISLNGVEREATFRLREGMNDEAIVTGRVRDVTTGALVKPESVTYRVAGRLRGFEFSGETEADGFRLSIPATRFSSGMRPTYQLKLEFSGYGTVITPWRDYDEGDWDANLVVESPVLSSRTILLPDGKPAANAQVWINADSGEPGFLDCHAPNEYIDQGLIQMRTDSDGRFNLPSLHHDEPLVAAHPDGLLETSLAELKDNQAARLQPWGRIEGLLRIGGQPRAGVEVGIRTLLSSHSRALFLRYRATTGSDGSFVFSNVPPGEYKIYRFLEVRRGESPARAYTEDHQMSVGLRPGETLRIQYGGDGRAVIGRAKADQGPIGVDWLRDDHSLTLKQPPIPHLNPEDFADSKSYLEAYRKSCASPEQLKFAREARTHLLEFQSDGSFRTEDVPAGTYELSIQVNTPGGQPPLSPLAGGKAKENLASFVCDVVVPQGKGALDLGTIVVPVKAEIDARK